MTIFDDGLAVLSDALRQATEIGVTYCQTSGRFFTVLATRGRVSYGTINRLGGIPMDVDAREYIIRVDALPVGFIPQSHDVIVDNDGKWETFNSTSQDCWRYCDPNQKLIRILTRRIK